MEACCTCARLLSDVPVYSEKTEKYLPQDRRLECCGRVICGDCLHASLPVTLSQQPHVPLTRLCSSRRTSASKHIAPTAKCPPRPPPSHSASGIHHLTP